MKKLVLGYCPQGNGTSIAPFDRVFGAKQDISKSIEGVDAVVFWGGTDIHPSLYKEKPHKRSQCLFSTPSSRDIFEWNAMKYCLTNNIPMIGVCRGAQMLCAFAGGRLIQDCDGHVGGSGGGHPITVLNGPIGTKNIYATSCHHQMMYPFDVPHEMLGWSSVHQSSRYENAEGLVNMDGKVEPEIVYFPDIKGFAIQGHPEWAENTPFADHCNKLINELFFQTIEV